jgi:2-polyprenyl-3-methyl-5-hydroxy-6-metoxy-1,4-benzoquinol methylase
MDEPYRAFRSLFASEAVRSAWAKSYGDLFWEASEPPQSQVTVDDIEFVTQRLCPSPETKLADLGCGGGCVGRYFASNFGAAVEGIDADPLAVRMAEDLAAASAAEHLLHYTTGDLCKTGWEDNSFDGALSMDVLVFVADKKSALRETARILRAGGRFVGTSWELRADSSALHAAAFYDYRSAFEDAGFEIEIYEETRNWRCLLTGAIGAVLESEAVIRREVEGPAAKRLLRWAQKRPEELDDCRRICFSVRRPR